MLCSVHPHSHPPGTIVLLPPPFSPSSLPPSPLSPPPPLSTHCQISTLQLGRNVDEPWLLVLHMYTNVGRGLLPPYFNSLLVLLYGSGGGRDQAVLWGRVYSPHSYSLTH